MRGMKFTGLLLKSAFRVHMAFVVLETTVFSYYSVDIGVI